MHWRKLTYSRGAKTETTSDREEKLRQLLMRLPEKQLELVSVFSKKKAKNFIFILLFEKAACKFSTVTLKLCPQYSTDLILDVFKLNIHLVIHFLFKIK
jgi:hypothetical protein